MKNIIITATAESVEQAQALIDAGVDRIYVGEKDYGLRLPQTLSYDEINRIAQLVHAAGKELTVAVNALMHQSMMDSIKPFLDFLKEIQLIILLSEMRAFLCLETRWLSIQNDLRCLNHGHF